jgi:hypothetical protein
MMNFTFEVCFFHTLKWYFTCREVLWRGVLLYFPSETRRAADFIAIKKPIASAGFEPANLSSNGKHTKHYTAEATDLGLMLW